MQPSGVKEPSREDRLADQEGPGTDCSEKAWCSAGFSEDREVQGTSSKTEPWTLWWGLRVGLMSRKHGTMCRGFPRTTSPRCWPSPAGCSFGDQQLWRWVGDVLEHSHNFLHAITQGDIIYHQPTDAFSPRITWFHLSAAQTSPYLSVLWEFLPLFHSSDHRHECKLTWTTVPPAAQPSANEGHLRCTRSSWCSAGIPGMISVSAGMPLCFCHPEGQGICIHSGSFLLGPTMT